MSNRQEIKSRNAKPKIPSVIQRVQLLYSRALSLLITIYSQLVKFSQ